MFKNLILAAAVVLTTSGAFAAVNPWDVANDGKAKAGTVSWYLTPSSAIAQGNEPGMEPVHNQD